MLMIRPYRPKSYLSTKLYVCFLIAPCFFTPTYWAFPAMQTRSMQALVPLSSVSYVPSLVPQAL